MMMKPLPRIGHLFPPAKSHLLMRKIEHKPPLARELGQFPVPYLWTLFSDSVTPTPASSGGTGLTQEKGAGSPFYPASQAVGTVNWSTAGMEGGG